MASHVTVRLVLKYCWSWTSSRTFPGEKPNKEHVSMLNWQVNTSRPCFRSFWEEDGKEHYIPGQLLCWCTSFFLAALPFPDPLWTQVQFLDSWIDWEKLAARHGLVGILTASVQQAYLLSRILCCTHVDINFIIVIVIIIRQKRQTAHCEKYVFKFGLVYFTNSLE